MIKGKKGGEKLLSIWWFFILGVIGGFIVLGVVIYYSADTNTNLIESSILVDKLVDCFIVNGDLNKNFLNDSFDLLGECNLDKKMFGLGSFLYFNLSIYDGNFLVREFINGTGSFQTDCKVGMEITAKYFPSCARESYFAKYDGKLLRIDILGGSNQLGSKIPIK